MRAGVCALLLAGCGRVGFDARSDGTPDVAFPTGTWTDITEVAELNIGPKTDDPTLTGDMLELYFDSDRDGTGDIYLARRDAVGDPWSPPTKVVELSTDAIDENTPDVSLDGLEMFFSRKNPMFGDMMHSTRLTRFVAWSPPQFVTQLNTPDAEGSPSIAASGLTLYLVRNVNNNNELMTSTRSSLTSPLSPPTVIAELSSPDFDSDCDVRSDELEILWGSLRGSTQIDIWRATRASTSEPFGSLERLDELATSGDDGDPWLSPDGHTLYFSRGSDQNVDNRIMMATR